MASVPSVHTRTRKQGQFGVPGEPLQARGTSVEPALGHAPICLRSVFFVFSLPRRRLRGCLEPQLFFIASSLKKALSIFLERGGKKEYFLS